MLQYIGKCHIIIIIIFRELQCFWKRHDLPSKEAEKHKKFRHHSQAGQIQLKTGTDGGGGVLPRGAKAYNK